MLAIAIQIQQFPANVRSDTYQIDYGRINGVEWMARSASRYAPVATELGELGDVDSVVATLIMSEEARCSWSGTEAVAVRAILALSRANDRALKIQARVLMAELINERHGRPIR